MDVKDFYYDLPEELIAQTPLQDRASSKLLCLDRESGATEHLTFRDIKSKLRAGDCLVMNDTRVIPARIYGVKKDSGAAIEFVLLKRIDGEAVKELELTESEIDDAEAFSKGAGNLWEVILRPGRRAKPGAVFIFGEGLLEARIIKVLVHIIFQFFF